MTSPQRTLDLLDELEALGFDDSAFAKLHHFRLMGVSDTIQKHRDYCKTQNNLRSNDSNEEVQRRLQMVLKAYKAGGFSSCRPEVFMALAEAAFVELPPRRAPNAV